MENNSQIDNNIHQGNVKISDEVVSTITGLAATEIEGVFGMSGGFADIFGGKKNLSKGVKVEITDDEATVDLFVIVEYGVKIPDIAWKVQENVKNTVETMTGLRISEVNIHVQGVNIPKKEEKKEEVVEETE